MTSTTRGSLHRAGGRWRARAVLLAVLSIAAMTLAPGAASATTGTVRPVVNCYTDNGNGTYTAVLGYTNSGTTRQIPAGPGNQTNPTAWQSKVPTTFKPGTNNGVASVTLTQAQLAGSSSASWTLDGYTLNAGNVGSVPKCTASQLPALANGAALLAAFVAAGLFGVLALRRTKRRALVPPAGPLGA